MIVLNCVRLITDNYFIEGGKKYSKHTAVPKGVGLYGQLPSFNNNSEEAQFVLFFPTWMCACIEQEQLGLI